MPLMRQGKKEGEEEKNPGMVMRMMNVWGGEEC